jgi:hypothetical protein
MSQTQPYVVRVRFSPAVVLMIVFFLVLAVFWWWQFGMKGFAWTSLWGWGVVVPPVLFFAGAAVDGLVHTLRRPVGLQVDQDGVTLGRSPGPISYREWWHNPQVTVPWQDIQAVVLFERYSSSANGRASYVGLRLRPGAATPPGPPSDAGFWRRLGGWLGRERPPKGLGLCRMAFGWKIDAQRLKTVVKQHSGGAVRVDDRR